MKCLSCGNEMTNNYVITQNKKISYDICDSCGGTWLDKGELDRIVKKINGSIEYSSSEAFDSSQEPVKLCPRCDKVSLSKVHFVGYSDLVLDRCENCEGFWLDSGELDKINQEMESILTNSGKSFARFVMNAFVPYWNQRIRRKSSQVDFKKEVEPIKHARKISETSYSCPVCDPVEKMYLYTIFGVEFEACPNCHGVFLDTGELRKLKDEVEDEHWYKLRWMDDEVDSIESSLTTASNRMCPKCEYSHMMSTNYGESNVLIDWCPHCKGVWLDYKEFDEIVDYLKEKLLAMTSSEMKDKVVEEIKEIWNGPETRWEEVLDSKAAISALLSIAIFEHPRLYRFLNESVNTLKSSGMI
ncbi:MAG: zf-TFIIB domain-containing protein [Vulcanimicrobiota bacterium]